MYGPNAVQGASLRMPSEARAEVREIAANLKEYKAFKAEQMFLSRRDRQFRVGWKHGVVGFDDADSAYT